MGRKRRGHDIKRTCEKCHERVSKARAFSDYRRGFKVYLCPMCAKRKGIKLRHAYIRTPQPEFRKRRFFRKRSENQ
ncbi:MAG: hypothetical protein FK732_09360 [Asgard group archaeon]|nr:hypothetical protein [Asgard group archaeon]